MAPPKVETIPQDTLLGLAASSVGENGRVGQSRSGHQEAAGAFAVRPAHRAIASAVAGISISTPVPVATVRAENPTSRNRPARYAVTANVRLPSPRSAEKTRPRKRSSV